MAGVRKYEEGYDDSVKTDRQQQIEKNQEFINRKYPHRQKDSISSE